MTVLFGSDSQAFRNMAAGELLRVVHCMTIGQDKTANNKITVGFSRKWTPHSLEV
jgi:hypothetical protein